MARTEKLPHPGGILEFADVRYVDGHAERYLLCDEAAWASLLTRLSDGPIPGAHGRLELRGETLPRLNGERVPAVDQTNTLVVVGERVLVKAYRRLTPGVHPELEMLTALGGTDAPVPELLGSLHYVGGDGTDTAVAALEVFVAEAEGGWEAPIERVARHLRGDGEAPLAEYGVAGAAAARLHEGARKRLGQRKATTVDATRLRDRAIADLARATAVDATLDGLQAAAVSEMAALSRLPGTRLQRIHGDLHYAQFLRAGGTATIIDFEGDPTQALSERREPAPAIYDLACLTRSIDHIGSAASRRAGNADPLVWIEAARRAALDGYGAVDEALLHVLEVTKECSEIVYAQRTVPEWLYAPRLGLERLLEKGSE